MLLSGVRKKVDMSTLNEEEQKLFRLYGKLPTHKNALTNMQRDRKYFDSGDYVLSQRDNSHRVGNIIPSPDNIPPASSPPSNHINLSVSPNSVTVKESHFKESFVNESPANESSAKESPANESPAVAPVQE